MVFIRRGKADAVSDDGVTVFSTFKPGDYIGEHSLLHFEPREVAVRAVEFVDALMLQRSDFTELYVTAPDFVRELQRVDVLRCSAAAWRKAQPKALAMPPRASSKRLPSVPGSASAVSSASSGTGFLAAFRAAATVAPASPPPITATARASSMHTARGASANGASIASAASLR